MLMRSPFRCMLLARLPSLMLVTCLHWGHPLQLTHHACCADMADGGEHICRRRRFPGFCCASVNGLMLYQQHMFQMADRTAISLQPCQSLFAWWQQVLIYIAYILCSISAPQLLHVLWACKRGKQR